MQLTELSLAPFPIEYLHTGDSQLFSCILDRSVLLWGRLDSSGSIADYSMDAGNGHILYEPETSDPSLAYVWGALAAVKGKQVLDIFNSAQDHDSAYEASSVVGILQEELPTVIWKEIRGVWTGVTPTDSKGGSARLEFGKDWVQAWANSKGRPGESKVKTSAGLDPEILAEGLAGWFSVVLEQWDERPYNCKVCCGNA